MNPSFAPGRVVRETNKNPMRILLYSIIGLSVLLSFAVHAAEFAVDQSSSKVEVAVKATVNSFVGELRTYETAIEIDEAASVPTKAEFRFDFKDLMTGKEKQDKKMLKWLDYAKFPKARFTMTEWKDGPKAPAAVGDLVIHGVKNGIEIPIEVTETDDGLQVRGVVVLDYRLFDLKVIRIIGLLKVHPEIKVSFVLNGKRSAGTGSPRNAVDANDKDDASSR